jgi:hypothetical protein
MIRRRSSRSIVLQAAISARLRPHPVHNRVAWSISHTFTQGVSMAAFPLGSLVPIAMDMVDKSFPAGGWRA